MPFIDNLRTRFNNGVNNEDVGSIFNALRFPSHLDSHYFEEDFYTFTAGQWTETDIQGVNTVAIGSGDGGLITMLLAGADDDEVQIQRIAAGVTAPSYLMDPDKRFFIEILATLSEVLLSEILIGLAITDTSLLAGHSDGISFRKAEATGLVTLVSEKNSVEIAGDVGTIVDATAFRLQAYYDGQGSDGRLYGGLDGAIGSFSEPDASFPDDTLLTVSFAVRAGEAAAKTLTLDRIVVIQER
jgi:hypothetical protein